MESRSIQKVGNRSYAISLPKSWVVGNNLKEKTEVYLEITSNNEVLIMPKRFDSKHGNELEVNLQKIKNLNEFLVFCYVKNLDRVILTSKKIDYATSNTVKKVLKYLEGYDVTHEDSSKIVIEFLFKEVKITLAQLMQRMIYLMGIMIDAASKNDGRTLEDTEIEVDRLYHLSKRLLASCIDNHSQRVENRISSADELLFMNIIFKKLENLADNIYAFKERSASPSEIKMMNRLMDFLNSAVYSKKELGAVKQELVKALGEARGNYKSDLLHGMHKQCLDVLENLISIEFNREFFSKKSKA